MASQPKKRPLQPEAVEAKSRKRHRTKNTKINVVKADRTSDHSSRRPVPIEELQWKEVALPDQLHDAEGFLGLEEVDDVDVIRNAESGEVEYRSAERKTKKGKRKASVKQDFQGPDDATIDGDEEWEGFGDDMEPDRLNDPNDDAVKVAAKKRAEGRPKKSMNGNHTKQPIELCTKRNENAFATLDDEVLGQEADVSAWDALNLSPESLLALSKLGFSRPTPIQSATIPEIQAGLDVIGKASTGSGKTLAFGIPILEYYLQLNRPEFRDPSPALGVNRRDPCALILSPTRELAHQISKHLTAIFSNTPSGGPCIATVTGGLSVQKQRRLLSSADVVVGTPGRLWEVISEGSGVAAWLRKTHFLVVDEADRLLTEGHFTEFEEILNVLDRHEDTTDEIQTAGGAGVRPRHRRQTLVFSATFHQGLQQKLAGKARYSGGDLMDKEQSLGYLLDRLNFRETPKFIDVNPVSQMAEGLKEGLVECGALEKDLYLYSLLMYRTGKRTLIFTNSISSVRRLTAFLQELNLGVQALHSQMPQKARLRSVERFAAASSKHSILVATDVAARGLDIPHVQLVVHYHLPRTADMYVHRSGRTARADESGSSILLCAPDEVVGVRRLVAKVHAKSPVHDGRKKYYIRSLDLDRRVVSRLKARVSLAKRIIDSVLAKERKGHEDGWLRAAADELGIDYDSETFEADNGSQKGRGSGRQKADREARSLTKGDLAALKAELKSLLKERINVGVSERYLTTGEVDIDALLQRGDTLQFLGKLDGIGLDDD